MVTEVALLLMISVVCAGGDLVMACAEASDDQILKKYLQEICASY